MFRYIVDPQLIRLFPGERSVDQIAGGRCLVLRSRPLISGQHLDRCASHQHLDLVVTDADTETENEFGVDAASAVCAARSGMHAADLVEQPRMPDRPL